MTSSWQRSSLQSSPYRLYLLVLSSSLRFFTNTYQPKPKNSNLILALCSMSLPSSCSLDRITSRSGAVAPLHQIPPVLRPLLARRWLHRGVEPTVVALPQAHPPHIGENGLRRVRVFLVEKPTPVLRRGNVPPHALGVLVHLQFLAPLSLAVSYKIAEQI